MDFSLVVLLYAERRLRQAMSMARFLATEASARRCVFVINGDEIGESTLRAHWPASLPAQVVHHDNSGAEFGGYQRGLECLGTELPDRLIVMNDTVGSHDVTSHLVLNGFLRRLRLELYRFVVGQSYESQRRMKIGELWASRWIRTHFFGLDRDALTAIGSRLYHPHVDSLITPSPDVETFFGPHVRDGLRELLLEFLFRPGPWSWYAAQPLGEANCEAMAVKARAILQEKYFSMMLESVDAAFWDPILTPRERLRHRSWQLVRHAATRLSGRAGG